jgi:hypothetical protein
LDSHCLPEKFNLCTLIGLAKFCNPGIHRNHKL